MAATAATAAINLMRLAVHHRTEYHYTDPASNSSNEMRLTPPTTRFQSCEDQLIRVVPATRLSHYIDLNLNMVHFFEVPNPHQHLTIDSRSVVETSSKVDFKNLPYGIPHSELAEYKLLEECHPFLQESTYVELTPEAWRQALDVQGGSTDVFQTGYAIMEYIYSNYTYVPGSTSVSTHANDVISERCGVCQDFSHAMVAMCRSIGIPARYVSGYFYDATRDRSLRGSEASHAWVEIYLSTIGWVGLDPTNNKVTDDTYIILARGRDYRDVAPIRGSFYGTGRSAMSVHVQVERLNVRK